MSTYNRCRCSTSSVFSPAGHSLQGKNGSKYCMNRFIALIDVNEHPTCNHVAFKRFDGETFAHLQEFQLYTVTVLDDPQQNSSDVTDIMAGLRLHSSPVSAIVETLQRDLKEVLGKFYSFAYGGNRDERLVPVMWVRLGKLLFHDPRGGFNWESSYTLEGLERSIRSRHMSKIFDTCLPKEEFMLLNRWAQQDVLETWTKKRVVIEVEDERRPGQHLWCICPIVQCDTNPVKSISSHSKGVLELRKVRKKHVRHMVGDVACVDKRTDMRLVFFMKEYLPEFTHEEMSELKSCFNKASVDDTVKGGLNWHHHNMFSSSGRFKVVGSSHEVRTLAIGRGLRWCFQECNRVESEPSAARTSYEVSIRPVTCHECFKGRGEQTVKELMSSIEESLELIWENFI